MNGNNKTVEEVKEEKELGDKLEHSFDSHVNGIRLKPDNRTSVNDNKKDESKRCVAKLIQLIAEISLAIDGTLLSTENARIDKSEVRLI